MLTVNIICVGKLKEAYWRDACAEYSKRLGAFCRLGVIELPESRLSQKPSDSEIKAALASEAKLMLPYIEQKSAFNIAMCIEAAQLSSEELAQRIETAAVGGASVVNFVIGSSFGLDYGVKKACQMRLSMSKMTFPHQLTRVMTLEQIYRAFSINAGTKYHK